MIQTFEPFVNWCITRGTLDNKVYIQLFYVVSICDHCFFFFCFFNYLDLLRVNIDKFHFFFCIHEHDAKDLSARPEWDTSQILSFEQILENSSNHEYFKTRRSFLL